MGVHLEVVDPMMWMGGRTVEANPNGWVSEVGMWVDKMEAHKLRSGLLAEIGPSCNVQHTRARRPLRVLRGLHEDLSCTKNGCKKVGG